jgi:hypothetical protein
MLKGSTVFINYLGTSRTYLSTCASIDVSMQLLRLMTCHELGAINLLGRRIY